jgi:hypothetical protein
MRFTAAPSVVVIVGDYQCFATDYGRLDEPWLNEVVGIFQEVALSILRRFIN